MTARYACGTQPDSDRGEPGTLIDGHCILLVRTDERFIIYYRLEAPAYGRQKELAGARPVPHRAGLGTLGGRGTVRSDALHGPTEPPAGTLVVGDQ